MSCPLLRHTCAVACEKDGLVATIFPKESATAVSSDEQRPPQTSPRNHWPARHDPAGRPHWGWRFGRRGFGGDAPHFRRVADTSRDRGSCFAFQSSAARNGSGRRRTLRERACERISFGN